MDLKDTVDLMLSADYKERFIAEYLQTKERYERLKHFCNKIEAIRIKNRGLGPDIEEPAHDCPLDLLRDQQRIMGEYLHILEIRAVIEGIDLTKPITPKTTLISFAPILAYLNNRGKYIARDKDGALWLFNKKPKRIENEFWDIDPCTEDSYSVDITVFSEYFPFVKWEDVEPFLLKSLKGE